MKVRPRLAAIAAGIVISPLVLIALPANPASAHGWVTAPASRQAMCATGRVANCGDVQYEPQSVEAPKGSRKCSGGSRFTVLDDESKGWPATSIGSSVTVTWKLTAAHRTTTWQYYVDGNLHHTVNEGNTQPPFTVSHNLSGLPGGRHKILAVWNIGDTPMAFYSCIDVQVGGGGGGGRWRWWRRWRRRLRYCLERRHRLHRRADRLPPLAPVEGEVVDPG